MQVFTLNITKVVWPHVTNLLNLRYFWRHNPLFYHLNLIPCHYWSWQRNIYFFGKYFCPTYFFFVVKIYFSFWEMSFFVRPLKYASFPLNITRVVWPHVTNLLDLRYFWRHNPFVLSSNLSPWSLLKLAKKYLFFWWIFLSDILFLCRKVASKQRYFKQWPIWQNLLSF